MCRYILVSKYTHSGVSKNSGYSSVVVHTCTCESRRTVYEKHDQLPPPPPLHELITSFLYIEATMGVGGGGAGIDS